MFNLLWHEIRSRRNVIIGWGIGLTLFGLMYTTIYPQMEDQMAGLADLSIYQAMGVEVATFEGYFGSTVVGFVPILLGVYAIMASTSTLAGEEDEGTLELLLTTRLPRWQLVTAKASALLIVAAIIIVITGLGYVFGFSLIADQIETIVTRSKVFLLVLSALPAVWAFMMLGLWLGTLLPSRRMALMVGLVFLVASYFGENIGGMVASMEVIRPFSLFTYFDSSSAVFADGINFANIVVLLLFAIVCFALALVTFERRDVSVGNWPWQRVRLEA